MAHKSPNLAVANAARPIFIVDDNLDDASILRRILLKAEFDSPALIFSKVDRAIGYLSYLLAMAPEQLPSLVLVDLQMVSGVQLIAWIRKRPTCKNTVVVALMRQKNSTAAEKAIRMGANACIQKFPEAGELRAEIFARSPE
jgi:CheY-like chemotaxis protein